MVLHAPIGGGGCATFLVGLVQGATTIAHACIMAKVPQGSLSPSSGISLFLSGRQLGGTEERGGCLYNTGYLYPI